MASSQASLQSALTGNVQFSIASSQGITSAQQLIKTQQPNISYQIQRTQGNIAGLVSTQPVVNAKIIGQPNAQLVASSQGLVVSQAGIAVVPGIPGSATNSPIVNVAGTKTQMVPRTQTLIRPTAGVNVVSNTAAVNGASLIQQQQLRMMGLATGKPLLTSFLFARKM